MNARLSDMTREELETAMVRLQRRCELLTDQLVDERQRWQSLRRRYTALKSRCANYAGITLDLTERAVTP